MPRFADVPVYGYGDLPKRHDRPAGTDHLGWYRDPARRIELHPGHGDGHHTPGQLQRAWRECGVRLFPELFGKRCAGVGSDRRHREPSGYAAAYDPRLGDATERSDLWRGHWRGATHRIRHGHVQRYGDISEHGRRQRGDWRRASSRHWRRNLYNDWKRRRTSASVPCRLWKCYGHNFWGQFFGVFQRLRQQFESGYPASERPVFQLATSCQSKADRAGHAIVYHVRASSDMGLEPPDRPSEPRARNLGERK